VFLESITVGVLILAVASWVGLLGYDWALGWDWSGVWSSFGGTLVAHEWASFLVVRSASTVQNHHLTIRGRIVACGCLFHFLYDAVVGGALVHQVDLFDINVREACSYSDQIGEVGVNRLHCHLAATKSSFAVVHDRSVVVLCTTRVNSVT